jgi:branched-chain amino acid transport system ATP-binding protein
MALFKIENLRASYADGVEVLHGINLSVEKGEFVSLIGANGAGKTTTLRSIMGLVPGHAGSIRFRDTEVSGLATANIARLGITLVPEGRGIFPGLTVYENLRIAATSWLRAGASLDPDLEQVYQLFPALAERRDQFGWSLSGGQQQMLAIWRGILAKPHLRLLAEPSLGLAPNLVDQVFDALCRINKRGLAILLVEQNAFMALEVSSRAYVIERGNVVIHNRSEDLIEDERVKLAYLGG